MAARRLAPPLTPTAAEASMVEGITLLTADLLVAQYPAPIRKV